MKHHNEPSPLEKFPLDNMDKNSYSHVCYFCKSNIASSSAAMEVYFSGKGAQTILVPRCLSCKSIHYKPESTSNVFYLLGIGIGLPLAALSLLFMITNGSDSTFAGLAFMLGSALLLLMPIGSMIGHATAIYSIRNSGILFETDVGGYPAIADKLNAGWSIDWEFRGW